MSNPTELEFDLEKLFLPAWAKSADLNRYAKFTDHDRPDRDRRGADHGDRRDRPPGRRPSGDNRGRGDQPGRRDGPRGGSRFDRPRQDERREPRLLPPQISLALVPDERGVESLARQIKITGRAYPLFEIAGLILKKPDRYNVVFGVIKKPDGTVAQPLFVCNLDDSLWLSDSEAVGHVLRRHFDTFYRAEKTATDAPKGTYTFVAQCGLSGVILGPPNYHDYQNKLRKLHAEKFARMPFEHFKARVKIVKDEAVVKQWLDDQSWKTEFECLNVPEPLKLPTREAVEKHFREVHMSNIIRPVDSHTLTGTAAQALPTPVLRQLVREEWEAQMRFPLKVVNTLSAQFANHGLQFFKVDRTVTHVTAARPHFLDLDLTPVSERIKKIIEFINSTPKCTRRALIEALAPAPAVAPTPGSPAAETPPTPEQNEVIADLHWLIHQGHVIEFANNTIESAKKPVIRPPRPERKPAPRKPAATEPTATASVPTAADVPTPAIEASAPPVEAPAQPVAPVETAPPAAQDAAPPSTPTD
jgi:hypothetical protein